MSIALLVGAAIVIALAVVFGLTYLRGGRRASPLATVGGSGLLAVLLALGIALIGAGLAFGLADFLLAPVMLIAGVVLLVFAALAALESAVASRPDRGSHDEGGRENGETRGG